MQILAFSAAVLSLGTVLGWMLRGSRASQRARKLDDEWQVKFDEAARQRDRFHSENNKLRASFESQVAIVNKHEKAAIAIRTELQSAAEKTKSLSQQLFAANNERDDAKCRLDDNQKALSIAKHQVGDLEAEFQKAGEFYKGELEKAFEKRKTLEASLDDAKAEQESLNNLLSASRAETDSVNKMLVAAQTRLDNLDAVEQKVIALEAENAQLRHDGTGAQQEIDSIKRDVAELDELKVQNKELAHCLKSMEHSRKQYEKDAHRYRERADQSDKRSETLRVKLDSVEKSFTQMAKQHDKALKLANSLKPASESKPTPKPPQQAQQAQQAQQTQKAQPQPPKEVNGTQTFDKIDVEIDDLTKIVGIGKVFQQTLHNLGIYSYRQIASFGPSEVARVNMELKEFKGRMEQDDWIGQAKQLLYEKYGDAH